jgi:predicted ester cyclase
MTEAQKSIAKRYFSEFYTAPDADVAQRIVDEIVDDNFIDHSPVFGSEPNKQGFKRSIGIVQTAFSQDYTVEKLLQDGQFFVAIWSGKVTHNGTFLDFLPATGKTLKLSGITIYEIINSKITQHWEHFDQLGMMTQLGLIPERK